MIKTYQSYYISLFILTCLFVSSCTKWNLERNNVRDLPKVTLTGITDNSSYYAVNAEINDLGYRSSIVNYGIVYGKNIDPTMVNGTVLSKGATNKVLSFDVQIESFDTSTTYFARAFATNGAGTYYSVSTSFTTGSIPASTVSLISPSQGADVDVTGATFTWQVSGATRSHLQISNNSDFSDVIYDDESINGTSMNISNFTNNTTYYWRVRALVSGSWTSWSTAWYFSTSTSGSSGESVVLQSPANGSVSSSTTVSFSWQVNAASNSHIQVSTDASFANIVFDDSNISGTTTMGTGFSDGVTYYWKVRSLISGTWTNWSSIFYFSINTGSGGNILATLIPIPSSSNVESINKISVFNNGGSLGLMALGQYWSGSYIDRAMSYYIGVDPSSVPSFTNEFSLSSYIGGFDIIEVDNSFYCFQLRPYFGYPFERLEFGTDPYSTPTSPISLDDMPYSTSGLSLAKISGNIWGITVRSNDLVRMSFSSGVTSSTYNTFTYGVSNISEVEFYQDGSNIYVIAINTNDNLEFWNFGTSLATAGLLITEVDLPTYTSLQGVAMVNNGSNWYAVVVGVGNGTSFAKLLDFGGYPDNSFTETEISIGGSSYPKCVEIVKHNGSYHVAIGTEMGIYYSDISANVN